MGLFRHEKSHHAAIPEDERVVRYVYLVQTLPWSILESAHATAFEDLSPEQRRDLFARLRPAMTDEERAGGADDPATLAAIVRRANTQHAVADAAGTDVDTRAAMRDAGVLGVVTTGVLAAHSVVAYFTTGAGSLGIADEPEWVVTSYEPSAAGTRNAILGNDNSYGAGVNGFGGGGFSGASDGGGGFI
jgi:hypothetical protein